MSEVGGSSASSGRAVFAGTIPMPIGRVVFSEKVASASTAHRSTGAICSSMIGGYPQKCVEQTGAIITPHSVATERGKASANLSPDLRPQVASG
jgi:hypothetical protein